MLARTLNPLENPMTWQQLLENAGLAPNKLKVLKLFEHRKLHRSKATRGLQKEVGVSWVKWQDKKMHSICTMHNKILKEIFLLWIKKILSKQAKPEKKHCLRYENAFYSAKSKCSLPLSIWHKCDFNKYPTRDWMQPNNAFDDLLLKNRKLQADKLCTVFLLESQLNTAYIIWKNRGKQISQMGNSRKTLQCPFDQF